MKGKSLCPISVVDEMLTIFRLIMSVRVDISGLDKVVLLEALWRRSKPAAFFYISGVSPPEFYSKVARDDGQRCGWSFDYYAGRVMKCNLSGLSVDPAGYDRDVGAGAMQDVVSSLR